MATPGSSSNAGQGGNLPRINCPKCNLKVIKCLSKGKQVYYKCPNHFPQSGSCGHYWFEDKYVDYLRGNHPELLAKYEEEVCSDVGGAAAVESKEQKDWKLELMEMKVQFAELKVEFANLKLDVNDLKKNVQTGEVKRTVGMDNNMFVIVVFVGLVVALIAAVWNK